MPHSKYNKTSFNRGREKTGGRKAGVRNKLTREMNELSRDILEMTKKAAEAVGSDGAGKDGMVGYLENIAVGHPSAFCRLLGRVLEQELEDERAQHVYR